MKPSVPVVGMEVKIKKGRGVRSQKVAKIEYFSPLKKMFPQTPTEGYGVRLDREIEGCQWWNWEDDLEVVNGGVK